MWFSILPYFGSTGTLTVKCKECSVFYYFCKNPDYLRKGIKIKASFILMSWLMIFAHGLTPHNHYEDIPFHHEFHNKFCIDENSKTLIKPHSEDDKGCRISNLIFHKFTQDDQVYTAVLGPYSCNLVSSQSVIFDTSIDFISERFTETASLRAPPGV